jgi:hypothetical protein
VIRLVRQLARESRMAEREQQIYGVATFDELYRAREETLELRRRELVRPPAKGLTGVPRITKAPIWATVAYLDIAYPPAR